MKHIRRSILAAVCVMTLGVNAQTPVVTGYSIEDADKNRIALESGDRFYQFKGDTFRVEYSEPVDKTTWAIEQNGNEVLSGIADGSTEGDFTTVDLKDVVNNALMDKTLLPGIATFKVKEATSGDKTVKDPASIDLDFTEVPFITMFFPGKRDYNPMELRESQITYLYFQTGARILSAHGRVVQNGVDLGEVVFEGMQSAGRWSNTPRLTPTSDANAPTMEKIKNGTFTIEVTGVDFISPYDEQEKSVTSGDKPFDSVTYIRNIEGKLVEEEGLPGGKMLSWYSPDAEDGVVKYTFSLPVDISNAKCYLEYGQGESRQHTPVKFHLSDDGYTVIIDLRGELHDTATLSQGHTYVDDDGNIIVPTNVNLILEKIVSTNGGQLTSTIIIPDTGKEYTLTGQVFRNYEIVDLTFPTPRLERVEFYSTGNPAERFTAINSETDMMDLYISNEEYIVDATMRLASAGVTVDIPYSDITKATGIYTVALPESIIALGSENMVISLIDVTFSKFDGAEHIIMPLDFSGAAKEVGSINDLKALEAGAEAVLYAREGLKVTMSAQGYCFIEDESGAIQVMTADGSEPFEKGALIVGRLAGTLYDGGIFQLDIEKSAYSFGSTNVAFGTLVENLDDLSEADNCRLFSFSYRKHTLSYDPAMKVIAISDKLIAITDFLPSNYEMPEKIYDLTGIYYHIPGQDPIIILRDEFDINTFEDPTGIEEIAGASADEVVYTLDGVKVGTSLEDLPKGLYIRGGKLILR